MDSLYRGAWADNLLMRIDDALFDFPGLILFMSNLNPVFTIGRQMRATAHFITCHMV